MEAPRLTANMDLGLRSRRDRFGLQARMTASYVLVTAAAVLIVEAVALGVVLPNVLAGQDLNNRVVYTAGDEAERVGLASLSSTSLMLPTDFVLGTRSSVRPGQVIDQGQGLVVPQISTAFPTTAAPLTVALLLSTDGNVLSSSYPQRFPVGSSMADLVPLGAKSIGAGAKGTVSDTPSGQVAWTVQPVLVELAKNRGLVAPGSAKPTTPDAYVYVQAPVQPLTFGAVADTTPLLGAGLAVLLLALPVGALFGVITTRGLVRRLRRLARTTALVADGDFDQRVKPGSGDEVGRLERNFNEMAERLAAAMDRERLLADQGARLAERGRISRELHDSISQDLFSISLLAAGLEKALPADSPHRSEMHTLAETAESTNREMRALLLELRPVALDDKGLLPALEELATTYSARLGLKVDVDLEPVRMTAPAELTVLRIAQEGLANAMKHSRARTIKLALHHSNSHVELTVSDDGEGFDTELNSAGEGLGLRLMRERIREVGGSLSVTSRPGAGTVVAASIPGAIE